MARFIDSLRNLFSRSATEEQVRPEWLIVGLGNPGAQYENTRHNAGYFAADALLGTAALSPLPGAPALYAPIHVGSIPVGVLRSTTYMNNSGEAVAPVAARWGIPAEKIIVIHDELDLPLGKVRLRQGGNENGHNGLKSLTEHLRTRDYVRIRMGISRPPKGVPVVDYVLAPFEESPALDGSVELAARAARLIVSDGLARAQNVVHSA